MNYNRPQDIDAIIELALKEDLGRGDITTNAIFTGEEQSIAYFIAKESGLISGLDLASRIFKKLSDEIVFSTSLKEGQSVLKGNRIAMVKGPTDAILIAERTVLNFMQRMSGIASQTHEYVELIKHTNTKILDTRKTVPGHRATDKWAVLCGGGVNHRIRLDDRFLIKENHIKAAGSLTNAIKKCAQFANKMDYDAKIEVEVEHLDELIYVLNNHANEVTYVMLDNMSIADMEKAVELNNGTFKLEASGNITLDTVKQVAETGVDFISSGSLTHTVKALDISLLFE